MQFKVVEIESFFKFLLHSKDLATKRPLAVGEGAPHLFAHPALWIHLMADLHVIRIMHDVLNHVFEHRVAREYRIHLGAHILRLKKEFMKIAFLD